MGQLKYWILLGFFLSIWSIICEWPDKKFHFLVCDVGQGDATLIQYGFFQILIDGGPDSSVLSCLSQKMPFWDREIELVVATHQDSDHITGLSEVLKRYDVKSFVSKPGSAQTKSFSRLKQVVLEKKRHGMTVNEIKAIEKYLMGEIEITFLVPEKNPEVGNEKIFEENYATETTIWDEKAPVTKVDGGENNQSIVAFITFDGISFAVMGDAPIEEELALLRSGVIKRAQVIKIGHHGSKTSTSAELLGYMQPEIALVSVGANNPYKHPYAQVLESLKTRGINLYRTDKEGTLDVQVWGGRYSMNRR